MTEGHSEKKEFDPERANSIAAMVATYYKVSVSYIKKEPVTPSDVDITYSFAFGGIDSLAQQAEMADLDSVGRITLLFLEKHLGIEQDVAFQRMEQMMTFSGTPAGVEVMKRGAAALNSFVNEDPSALMKLDNLINEDLFTTSKNG